MRLTTCINIASAFSLSLIVPLVVSAGVAPPSFDSQNAMPRGNLKDLNFRSRIMVPYGPNLFGEPPLQTAQDRPWNGYGFGMGAGEELVYDTKEKYAYMGSAVGFVTVVDYQDPVHPKLTDYGISWGDELEEINDLAICPEQGWLFVSIASRGVIGIYKTIQRGDDTTVEQQELPLLKEVSINGGVPSNLLPNTNCTLLAVANENQGFQAYGTVTLLRDLENILHHDQEPTQTNIPMDFSTNLEEAWDDDYVLRKGLHMPLTRNALEYWDEHSPIANITDFTQVRNNYRSSLFLEGEFLAWASPDETELLVNLQTNNGLLRIDVNKNQALGLAGYGLKDHGSIPIDIDGTDKTCNLQTYPNLFALRSPDSIRTLRYNDKLYLLTANEGDDKGFEQYNEVVAAKELFVGEEFGLPKVRVPTNKMEHGALFNSNCQEQDGQGEGCVGDVELSVGSTSIDYELDPANPTFQRMVLLGGRGWTIYELPENPDALLKLVFDSGADVERSVCEKYPWAYNAEVDEEYAPTDLMPNHTLWNYGDDGLRNDLLEKNDPGKKGCLDQGDGTLGACPLENNIDAASDSSGAQLEHVEAGVACGRLVAVVASEKNSVAWLYDITDITTPDLIKTFHLSPAIQSKSPGLAYNDGTIGEIDPENFIFLSKEESPSGKAAMLFGGAFSGTLSYWEFECLHDDNIEQQHQGSSSGDDTSSSSSDIIIPAQILSSLSFTVLIVWVL